MESFVHFRPPFGTIADIIDDAVVGDPLGVTAFACIAAQFL